MDEARKEEFEELALRHMDCIYNAAWRLTGNREDAQDLTQDTFLRAYRFFDKFQEGTSMKAWLFKILKNVFINKYRKALKTPEMVELAGVESLGVALATNDPEKEFFGVLLGDEVSRAMDALPEEFRAAVTLTDLEGLSYQEISDILGVPIGTVMSRIHRGRRLLREALAEYAKEYGYAA